MPAFIACGLHETVLRASLALAPLHALAHRSIYSRVDGSWRCRARSSKSTLRLQTKRVPAGAWSTKINEWELTSPPTELVHDRLESAAGYGSPCGIPFTNSARPQQLPRPKLAQRSVVPRRNVFIMQGMHRVGLRDH